MSTTNTIRQRFQDALAGEDIGQPIYAVYDWFIRNRNLDWPGLFEQGLGVIGHADLLQVERPNVQVVETINATGQGQRKDVRWITDIGELHEWFLGEWRQEHLIKQPADYRILAHALTGRRIQLVREPYDWMDHFVGERGITLGQIGRTPFQEVQIDMAGLERFSIDLADNCSELMELLELMTVQKLEDFALAARGPAQYIKLWENLSIETMGPACFRRFVAPVYRRIFDILAGSGKRLLVHYDGKLRCIAGQIAALDFDGIDSFTQAPEGDMTVDEAHALWPGKFLWLHPNLGWYALPEAELSRLIRQMARTAGPRRYCLMISEDIPPDWERTVPAVLRACSETVRSS
jgi:hypothetical protein